MHRTTNLLLMLHAISITSFLTVGDGALQRPKHLHTNGCIPAERAALLAFKAGITRDSAKVLASWRGEDCCQWRGIKCSNRTGNVLQVRLRNSIYKYKCDETSLSGEISPSLLSLGQLEHMDLSMNCLLGSNRSMPDFFGSMENLRYLNLSGILFTGRVPSQLGNLSKLQYLDLSQHALFGMYSTDITWLTKLSLLQYLGMSSVNLSGIADWPHTLNMIPSLSVIILSECSLDSANQLLLHLNLTKLKKLDLSWNNFEHSVAASWFWKVVSLRYLNVEGTKLFGQFPDALGNMTSLQVLDLSNNMITGSTMTAANWEKLCSLEILDLYFNVIDVDLTVLMEGLLPQCVQKKLRNLDCGQNRFTGKLPNFIGNFTNLNVLDLSNNNLTGTIPSGIGYLVRLTYLDISINHLSGNVPSEIGALTNLTSLDLSNNNFIGSVPSEIGGFTVLTSLVVNNNKLSGVITEQHFASLKSLKNIDLSSNNLKIVIDSDCRPPFMLELEYAMFASCQMGPLFPTWLQWLIKIVRLDISSTTLKDNIPAWFWTTFKQALYLDISKNHISGSLPAQIDDMACAELYLGSNRLTGPMPLLPRNITTLDMSNNTFSGALPSNFEAPQLEILHMRSNNIGGNIPESMCKLQRLIDLDLSSNLLEGEIPYCLKTEKTQFLQLSNNSLSGTFPTFLQNSTSLLLLDLAWNKFSGRLPAWIGQLRMLRFLRLSNNAFFGTIPVETADLSYLQFLDLSGNNISGTIPWHLSNLTGMTLKSFIPMYGTEWGPTGKGAIFGDILSIITKGQQLTFRDSLAYFVSIDLSNNSLTGGIPFDITSLDALINLNLSSNLLSGNIPNKIGDLHILESLDLSENKLSGEIPPSLSSLTYLSYLNLSYNNLSGRIPSGRQLDTLNADNPSIMYIGNNGLCGPPVHKICLANDTSISSYPQFQSLTFYFGLGLEFVVGHSMVLCALLFKKTWRVAHFRLLDKLSDRSYVFVVVSSTSLARKTAAKANFWMEPTSMLQQ